MSPEVKILVPKGRVGKDLLKKGLIPMSELSWVASEIIRMEIEQIIAYMERKGWLENITEVELEERPNIDCVRVLVGDRLYEVTTEAPAHLSYLNNTDYTDHSM